MAVIKWSCLQLLLLAAAAWLAAGGEQNTPPGYINPPLGTPVFNPDIWNKAYKLLVLNVPATYSSKELLQRLRFPSTPLNNIVFQDCSRDGFDSSDPASVALGSCFVRQSSPSTMDLWIKLPGLARVNGNCYCYALDLFQGGYCYPGTRNGAVLRYRQRMTCRALADGVTSDGGEAVSRAAALSGQPSSGHYIALMARPESCIKGHCYVADFHVLRKDVSGTWSWKHPGQPATNRDLFGAVVTDPEAAALQGTYQLCGYFRVHPQKMLHVDAGSAKEPGPLPVGSALASFKSIPGVTIEVTPLPYNPSTDNAVTLSDQQAVAEDTAWERTRSSEQYQAWRIREQQALELLPRGVVSELVGGRSGTEGASGRPVSSMAQSAGQLPKLRKSQRRLHMMAPS